MVSVRSCSSADAMDVIDALVASSIPVERIRRALLLALTFPLMRRSPGFDVCPFSYLPKLFDSMTTSPEVVIWKPRNWARASSDVTGVPSWSDGQKLGLPIRPFGTHIQ